MSGHTSALSAAPRETDQVLHVFKRELLLSVSVVMPEILAEDAEAVEIFVAPLEAI